ncbi:MAG: ribonuclease P protein component [Patescibacteria group bacterium]
MLPKKNRLTTEEVKFLFKKGTSLALRHFFIRSRKNRKKESHFAIVFDKRISIQSNKRNFFRRAVYEAIRKNIELLTVSVDVAYIIKPSLLQEKRKNIESCVVEGLITLQKFYG